MLCKQIQKSIQKIFQNLQTIVKHIQNEINIPNKRQTHQKMTKQYVVQTNAKHIQKIFKNITNN